MYFDIDDILAEEERVSAVTTIEAFSLGFLDPSCEHEDLPANTKVRAKRATPRPPCAPLIKKTVQNLGHRTHVDSCSPFDSCSCG